MATKMIVLQTCDGETFEIEEKIAVEAQSLKHMIEDDCADSIIPLPNVKSRILAKVIEYLKKHVEAGANNSNREDSVDTKAFDEEFMKLDQETLFDLILAANYLNIKSLLDLGCDTVANMMKGKTPEEMRKHFHIKNDYTREEEDEVRRENAWAFE